MVDAGDVANLNDEIIKFNLEKGNDVDNDSRAKEEDHGNNPTLKNR